MNQESMTLPIDRASLSVHYKDVESFQRARARSARRVSKVIGAVASLSILTNLGLAWTVASLLPLTKLVPVYLWVRADGSVDSAVTLSRLPATQSQAVIDAALWEYTRLREGYSYDSALYAYSAVSLMSDATVRDSYQHWFNYPNPQSPQMTIGQRGQIDIEHIGSAMIAPTVEQIRYLRTVTLQGESPSATTWTATLQFATSTTLPALSRLSNPGGVIIVSYQSEEDGTQ